MMVRKIDPIAAEDAYKFIQFPLELYRDCENWAPPLVSSLTLAMNRRRHPFYAHSEAAFFLAERGDDVVGRIAVLNNRRYNVYRNSRVAFFYYFDVIEDQGGAEALFGAAADWARDQGLEVMMGPKGMVRSDAPGMLVEGFEHLAAMGMPYNYAYYPALMTSIGFEKEIDYISGYMTPDQSLPDRLFQLSERIKKRRGFTVKSFNTKRELRQWIPAIQRVNNEAFTEVWGYYPVDDAEIQMIGRQLLAISDPRLLKIVLKEGDIAGFAFVFPDVVRTLQATGGRLLPTGWLRLLVALRRTKRLLGNGVGLLPAYQGLGGSAMLYAELESIVRAREAEYLEFAQVMETNVKSLGDANMLGVRWHKRYRVYRRNV